MRRKLWWKSKTFWLGWAVFLSAVDPALVGKFVKNPETASAVVQIIGLLVIASRVMGGNLAWKKAQLHYDEESDKTPGRHRRD